MNTGRQNDVFNYRTSDIGYGMASLDTKPLTPVGAMSLTIELLALIITRPPT